METVCFRSCIFHDRERKTYFFVDCSRRDDLESLAYTLIYFLRGSLPWRKIRPPADAAQNPKGAWDKILEAKESAEASGSLTAGLPEEFDIFYRYARGLTFEDLPDYEGLRNLFRGLAKRERIEYDGVYDWSVVRDRIWRKGSLKRKRFCEACEAKAAQEAAESHSQASSSSQRSFSCPWR